MQMISLNSFVIRQFMMLKFQIRQVIEEYFCEASARRK